MDLFDAGWRIFIIVNDSIIIFLSRFNIIVLELFLFKEILSIFVLFIWNKNYIAINS